MLQVELQLCSSSNTRFVYESDGSVQLEGELAQLDALCNWQGHNLCLFAAPILSGISVGVCRVITHEYTSVTPLLRACCQRV